ncbi:MAG TPA: pyrroline-5-carboxylate reductase [Candidatus Omnitrophota bacterium]|nr:pyrroline-5-carboxylate reductase [Candidatus Omnitrophota bacterium]
MLKKIGFIGCGNMGQAILKGVVKNNTIFIAEKDNKRAQDLKKKFKIQIVDIETVIKKSSIIILAVKPQDFESVLNEMKSFIAKDQLVISIAAGITTAFIEKRLGKIKVIRTMPNLPAQVGVGMTAMAKGKYAGDKDLKETKKIFDTIGKTLILDEKYIDAITAVSGSGPAYVFLFVECMMKAAQRLGFDFETSKILVAQTIEGSFALLEKSQESPETLRQKVTSKGGTTQAALDVFFKAHIGEIFKKAFQAAEKRAKELSQ